MINGKWTPGYIGSTYSQTESSATAASRAAASPAAGIGFQPMADGAALTGSRFNLMPPPFFQPLMFPSVGTPVQMAPTYHQFAINGYIGLEESLQHAT